MNYFVSLVEYYKHEILDYYYNHLNNFWGQYYVTIPYNKEEPKLYRVAFQEAASTAGSYDWDYMVPSIHNFIQSLVKVIKIMISHGEVFDDDLIDAIDSLREELR